MDMLDEWEAANIVKIPQRCRWRYRLALVVAQVRVAQARVVDYAATAMCHVAGTGERCGGRNYA